MSTASRTAHAKTTNTAIKSAGGKGRPKGSKNKGGPLMVRLAERAGRIGFFSKNAARFSRLAAKEENKSNKSLLSLVASELQEAETRRQTAYEAINQLVEEDYTPPKVSTAAIDYTTGRQVWIKPTKQGTYKAIWGDDADDIMNRLFIKEVHEGKLVVRVNNAGIGIPLPKLHVTVRNPEAA